MNKKCEKYIQDLNEKMIINQDELTNYKMMLDKINLENKMNEDNKQRYNDALDKYEKIIKEERNKVKNAYSIINKLRSELDYVKDENLNLLKTISENNRKDYKLINFDENRILKEENEDIKINKESNEMDNNTNNNIICNENNQNQIFLNNNEDISFRNMKNEEKNSSKLLDNGNTLFNSNIICQEDNINEINNKTYEINYQTNKSDNGINNKKYIKYEEIMNININDKNDEFINDCYNSNGEINTS